MKLILFLSNFMLPFLIFLIFVVALSKKVDVYQVFVSGVKEGIGIAMELLPTLIALFVGVGVLRAGGTFELMERALRICLCGITNADSVVLAGGMLVPFCMLPIFLLRLFSSSAATGLLLDVYQTYGTDSLEGIMGSLALSCTEAVFYCVSIYFVSVGILKTRWTIKGALLSTLAGLLVAVVLANFLYTI